MNSLFFTESQKLSFPNQNLSNDEFQRKLVVEEKKRGGFDDVLSLDLRCNRITDFSFLQKFPHLKSLNVNSNRLLAFPLEICQLRELVLLSISFNHELVTLPAEIGHLVNLEYLAFSDMRISRFPPAMKYLTKVCYFMFEQFWRNPIKS